MIRVHRTRRVQNKDSIHSRRVLWTRILLIDRYTIGSHPGS